MAKKRDIYDLLVGYSENHQLNYHGCTPVPGTCAWDFEIVQEMYRMLTDDGTGYEEFGMLLPKEVYKDFELHPYIYSSAVESTINLMGLRHYMVVYFLDKDGTLRFVINIVSSEGVPITKKKIGEFKNELKEYLNQLQIIGSNVSKDNVLPFGRRESVYENRRTRTP